jgi:peptidoglycan/LPS O-acetylase OafA/YrhL
MFFFFIGMLFYKYKGSIISKFVSVKYVLILSFIFIVSFVTLTLFIENQMQTESNSVLKKLMRFELVNYSKIIYATFGLFLTYLVVNYLIEKRKIRMPQWLYTLASYLFGIYIFQQFILQFLYYKTDLPAWTGAVWLPWAGFIITMIVSIMITKYTLKTKLGKILIG